MGHSVLELLTLAAGYLEKRGVPSARREADALLGHVLGCDRLHLYLRFEEQPQEAEVGRFRELMRRRGDREPIQYILGKVRFLGRDLSCDARALIPRPETEDLVKHGLRLLGEPQGKRCADVGTGSGCIAVSLALAGASVVATDISAPALELARANAAQLGCEAAIRFAQGSLCEPLPEDGSLDLLLSNPPYISYRERKSLSPEVVDFEPAAALFADDEGLGLLQALLEEAPTRLKPGGHLVMECGLGQAAGLVEAGQARGYWKAVGLLKDSYDVDRFLVCERA